MKHDRKWIALLLAVAVCLTLAACGSGNDAQVAETSEETTEITNVPAAETETETTPAPETAETPEPGPEPEAEPENTYYRSICEAARAYDASLELPDEESLLPEGKTVVKYVQGTYGQGIYLLQTLDGETHTLLKDGEAVTVLATREGGAFVRVGDGRYGWVHAQYLADRFDEQLSFERKRDYLAARPEYWTAPTWIQFILDNASELPPEMVEAAQNAANG